MESEGGREGGRGGEGSPCKRAAGVTQVWSAGHQRSMAQHPMGHRITARQHSTAAQHGSTARHSSTAQDTAPRACDSDVTDCDPRRPFCWSARLEAIQRDRLFSACGGGIGGGVFGFRFEGSRVFRARPLLRFSFPKLGISPLGCFGQPKTHCDPVGVSKLFNFQAGGKDTGGGRTSLMLAWEMGLPPYLS